MSCLPNIYLYFKSFKDIPAPFGFETRGINCPDGITRLLTYPRHVWDWNDYFVEEDTFSESRFDDIETCWTLTEELYPNELNARFPITYFLNIVNKYKVFNNVT